jgi:hypothetical protein
MPLRLSAFLRCPGDVRLKLARAAGLPGSVFPSCPHECLSCPLGNAARGCFASGVATLRGCAHVRRSQTLTRHNFSERERIRENLVGEGPREIERRAPRSETLSARATGERFRKTRQHARRSCVGTLPWPTPVGSRSRADLAQPLRSGRPVPQLRARESWPSSKILTERARPGEADRARYLSITVSGASGPSAGARAGSRPGRPGGAPSARRDRAGGRLHSPRLLRDLVERDPREGASSRQLDDRSTEPARRHEPRAIEARIVGLKHTHNREHDFNRRVGLIQSRRKGNVILPRHAGPIPLVHLSHHVTSQTVTEQKISVKYCDSDHSRASVSTFLASCSHRGSSQRSTQSKPDQPTPARDQFKTQPLTANVCLSQTFPRGTT